VPVRIAACSGEIALGCRLAESGRTAESETVAIVEHQLDKLWIAGFEPRIAGLGNHLERTSRIDPVIVDRFAVGVIVRPEGDELKAFGAGLKGPRHPGCDAHCV
jgi:hypothetical protein